MDFLFYLLDQRAALGKAVRDAKAGLELDMDLERPVEPQINCNAAEKRSISTVGSRWSRTGGKLIRTSHGWRYMGICRGAMILSGILQD